MKRSLTVPVAADPHRDLPAAEGARIDALDAALATLHEEERRLSRMGLDLALRRVREQRRYWEFLRAVMTLPRRSRAPKGLAA